MKRSSAAGGVCGSRRSAQTRRSIFQAQEGEDNDIQAIVAAETAKAQSPTDEIPEPTEETVSAGPRKHIQGIIETYFASSYGAAYPALNFAVATNSKKGIEMDFATKLLEEQSKGYKIRCAGI